MNKARKKVLALVLTLSCATAGLGLFTACNDGGETSEHTHSYTQWAHDNEEHWKVCPDDGAIDESSREDHVFVAGECECGATEAVAPQKYGSASGQVRLHKLGDYVTDYAGVTVDMGNDDVTIEYDETTGKFTIENIVADQQYTLTVSKNGYKPSSVLVQVGENENVTIGGQNGIVLEYDAFQTLMNWDFDAIDFGHANDEDPYLTYNRASGTFNVLTNESYDSVSATLRINWNNSTNNMRTQGIILVFEGGRHAVVRYHNGDTNGNIQYCNTAWDYAAATTVFGDSANLNQWGENNVHPLTNEERAAITTGDGLDLTVVVDDGQLRTYFAGDWVTTYDLPDDLGKVQVGYFAWDTADKSVFYYGISEEIPSLTAKTDIKVEQPEGIEAAVTADKTEYVIGEQITLTIGIPEGYKLDVITVNGKDMTESVSDDGKLTVTATRNTMAVGVTVVREEPIALNLTIKGKKLGTTAVLPAETTVTFKGTDYTFTVGENGKVTAPSVVKGKYIVVVDGYLEQEITFNETLTEITLEYDSFYHGTHNGSDWSGNYGNPDNIDKTHVNDADPYFIINNGANDFYQYTNTTYTDVKASVTYVQGTAANVALELVFEDGKAVMIRIEGTQKAQWIGGGNWEEESINPDWDFGQGEEYFNPLSAELLAKYASEGLTLTLVRNGVNVIAYVEGMYAGAQTLPEEYADQKCRVCFAASGVSGGKEVHFSISETLESVAITNTTAADANGSITVPATAKLGGTVKITVTPAEAYQLDVLKVNGVDVTANVQNNTYTFIISGNTTVEVAFEKIAPVDLSFGVTGHKYNADGNALEGQEVTLSDGTNTYTASVTDGTAVFKGVAAGSNYTLSAEGYASITGLEVTEDGLAETEYVLKYELFGSLMNWDWDNHDFTHVNDENAYITYTGAGGTLNVLTNDTYENVSATLRINWNNSTNNFHTQGIILVFENNKHLIVRYHNGDTNGNIQYCNTAWDYNSANTLFDASANLNQYGEKSVHDLTDEERAEITTGEGIDLTVSIRDGKLYTYFGGVQVTEYTIPAEYADQGVRVGFFSWDTAANSEIYFAISEGETVAE